MNERELEKLGRVAKAVLAYRPKKKRKKKAQRRTLNPKAKTGGQRAT